MSLDLCDWQVLHERLDAMIDPRLETTDHQIQTMNEALDEANKLGDGTFINEHHIHGNTSRSRESLAGLCARMDQGTVEAPHWQDVRLVKTDNSHQLITSLFGALQVSAFSPYDSTQITYYPCGRQFDVSLYMITLARLILTQNLIAIHQ